MSCNEIIVVSGLPRSGTSMVMQMLAFGGIPVFIDNSRPPDRWNPCGYYECADVKALSKDKSCIYKSQGSAIKVVSPLLIFLPENFHYRVLFILRNIKDTLASQRKMIGSDFKSQAYNFCINDVASHIIEVRDFLMKKDMFSVLWLQHRTILKNPHGQARLISKFINKDIDILAMASVVRPDLVNRNKSELMQFKSG